LQPFLKRLPSRTLDSKDVGASVGSSGDAAQLSAPEMAFLRAWAEGLDLLRAWRQYLDPDGHGGDLRQARLDRRRLVGRLRTVAQRHGRGDLATLLRRDPEAMADTATTQPTLDEFREQQPPDFYSEAELLALYQAEHGRSEVGSAARRRQRLRARLVAALQALDTLAQPAQPQPGDSLALWLDGRVAQRLAAAGLSDIAGLQACIAEQGGGWHRGIARLGAIGAARIAQWLDQHRGSLGGPAAATQATPARQAATPGIVPLERWAPPPALAGNSALARAADGSPGLNAANDAQAVQAWLAQFPAGSATWRAYRKAAERWVLWATVERGCAMSALAADDLPGFAAFLAEPGKSWTAPRCTARLAPGWRPFEGGLSPRSVAMTVGIVRALSLWLVRQGYLVDGNWTAGTSRELMAAPVKGRTLVDDVPVQAGHPAIAFGARPAAATLGASATLPLAQPHFKRRPLRGFEPAHWAVVQHWLSALPDGPGARRTAALLGLGVGSGLRLAELAAARWDWLEAPPAEPADGPWHLCIPGHAARARRLPLSRSVVADLLRWREACVGGIGGRGPMAVPSHEPMFRPLKTARPLSATRLYEVVQEAFQACAAAVASHDAAAAAALARASTVWLRHTFGAHTAQAGASSASLQRLMGYSRPDAAAPYRQWARRRQAASMAAATG
jgi:integrase